VHCSKGETPAKGEKKEKTKTKKNNKGGRRHSSFEKSNVRCLLGFGGLGLIALILAVRSDW